MNFSKNKKAPYLKANGVNLREFRLTSFFLYHLNYDIYESNDLKEYKKTIAVIGNFLKISYSNIS